MLTMDFQKLNEEFENRKPQEIVNWAVQEFAGSLAMTSSFGPESGVLLHMVSQADPKTPVLFLETGYHFPETLEYRDRLKKRLGLENVVDLRADGERRNDLKVRAGDAPYEADPDLCCRINKVEPLEAGLKPFRAWMSGIRRHQTDFRKSIRILEEYEGGRVKISPLANFTSRDAWWYLKEHAIPQHPLFEKGYLSIGCQPCTRPIQEGDDERSGRWAGRSKTECGIHLSQPPRQEEPAEDEDSRDIGADI